MISRMRSSRVRMSFCAVSISWSIAVYSRLVFTSSSWSLYFASRVCTPATSFSSARRLSLAAASLALMPATASRAPCSRASSACVRAGWSAILRRASSAAVSSCCRRMRRVRSGFICSKAAFASGKKKAPRGRGLKVHGRGGPLMPGGIVRAESADWYMRDIIVRHFVHLLRFDASADTSRATAHRR